MCATAHEGRHAHTRRSPLAEREVLSTSNKHRGPVSLTNRIGARFTRMPQSAARPISVEFFAEEPDILVLVGLAGIYRGRIRLVALFEEIFEALVDGGVGFFVQGAG